MRPPALPTFILALGLASCGQENQAVDTGTNSGGATGAFVLQRSSFLGGRGGGELVRDVAVDGSGNIYLVGGTSSTDFPATPGAPQTAHGGGPMDAVIAKVGPTGVVWATYLGGGGAGDEYAYAVEVDPAGNVVVTGRAAPGFPVTAGVLQPSFQGHPASGHGLQNAFVAKFSPSGTLVFSTYFGTGAANRDLALQSDGTIVLASRYEPATGQAPFPAAWFAGGYQATPRGGPDCVIAGLSADGQRVVWATYLGGSGDEEPSSSVRVGPGDRVYFSTVTASVDAPTTAGAYDRTLDGPNDSYVAALSPNGASLIYGTYIGGSGEDYSANVHNLAVDNTGSAIVYGETTSQNFPVTSNAFQRTYGGAASGSWEATSDAFLAKLSPDGRQLVAATYLGGNQGERVAEGIAVDSSGNVYVSGGTYSANFPVTSGAYQSSRPGSHSGTVAVLPPDLTSLRYSTYFGGNSPGGLRSCAVSANGLLVVAGLGGSDWPTVNALQAFAGGDSDIIVATFAPAR